MRCDIIIASWNAVAMTRTALASIRDESDFPYRLILVDNSDEEDARAVYRQIAASKEYGETLLIQNEENIGWLKATNIGLRQADAEYVCLLNNDVVCGSGWLQRSIALLQRCPEIGLVNPRGNERSENLRVSNVNTYARELAEQNAGLHTEIDCCSGYCMVARGSLFRDVGLLDEIYDLGYYEDFDYSRRVREAGFSCAQCDDAYVLHLGSQSFRKVAQGPKREMQERNRKICEQRWGVVKSQLVLIDGCVEPDVAALIALIRRGRVYLIDTDNVPDEVRKFRHEHLILMRPNYLGARLYFQWQSFYLAYGNRIDEAHILCT